MVFFMADAVSTKVGKARAFPAVAGNITAIRVTLGTTGGSATTVDVNKSGTTVYTTQANRPSITSAGVATATAPDVTAFNNTDNFTVDVDAAGPGATDLMVIIEYGP
jgi:hypothetical protein